LKLLKRKIKSILWCPYSIKIILWKPTWRVFKTTKTVGNRSKEKG
jgi:hypothetical protein